EVPSEAFRLHVGKVQSQAHMRTASKRNEGELVTLAGGRGGKAHRVVALGLRPQLRHVMGEQRIDIDAGAGWRGEALKLQIAGRAARKRGQGRDQPHRFLERHPGRLELLEPLEREWL